MNTPFRYDFVGSFLRPQKLKDARKNFEEGTISQEKLTAVEDECILELVAKIKELGFHVGILRYRASEDSRGEYNI